MKLSGNLNPGSETPPGLLGERKTQRRFGGESVLLSNFNQHLCDINDGELNRIAHEVGSRANAFESV